MSSLQKLATTLVVLALAYSLLSPSFYIAGQIIAYKLGALLTGL